MAGLYGRKPVELNGHNPRPAGSGGRLKITADGVRIGLA